MQDCKPITGPWTLADAYMPKNAGKVFSCFACAGGSTMGYKLAGFDVIGCNEIDPKVFAIYKLNHRPKFSYVCSIRDMLTKELEPELYDLDILDGSPPCTSFSTAGVRDRDWGKTKKFAEGQALQRLDDLFFEFIALANKLRPKVVVSENVTGMIKGKARGYVKEILAAFKQAGYSTQVFDLNAAKMGVPQSRRRVFFVSRRDDLGLPKISLNFSEQPIAFSLVEAQAATKQQRKERLEIMPCHKALYYKTPMGKLLSTAHPKRSFFNKVRLSFNRPAPTLTANYNDLIHPTIPRYLSENEWLLCSSFPLDMNWGQWSTNKSKWAMGMSVPPFMVQRIALEIKKQWGLNG